MHNEDKLLIGKKDKLTPFLTVTGNGDEAVGKGPTTEIRSGKTCADHFMK